MGPSDLPFLDDAELQPLTNLKRHGHLRRLRMIKPRAPPTPMLNPDQLPLRRNIPLELDRFFASLLLPVRSTMLLLDRLTDGCLEHLNQLEIDLIRTKLVTIQFNCILVPAYKNYWTISSVRVPIVDARHQETTSADLGGRPTAPSLGAAQEGLDEQQHRRRPGRLRASRVSLGKVGSDTRGSLPLPQTSTW